MNTTAKFEAVKNYTQERLNNWYKNAKIDYNVEGNAYVEINQTEMSILFTENDVTDTFSMSLESVEEEHIDYLFNVWSELA